MSSSFQPVRGFPGHGLAYRSYHIASVLPRMAGTGSNQRSRTKASDLTDLFRPTHGSRHASKNITAEPSSSTPSQPDKTTSKSRRSMLPFLGRKKSAEQPIAAPSRKSTTGAAPAGPPSTFRRSFGNGRTVIMVTPSSDVASAAPPLPTSLPPLNVSPSSLGSKFAAHFTPLRSPSKSRKCRQLVAENVARPSGDVLSLPVSAIPTSSGESPRSSLQSRSTTPRPHHVPPSSVVHGDDGEDYSDLFLRPDQLQKSLQDTKSTYTKRSPKECLGDPPASPTPPSSPCLHFPIPPPIIGRPPIAASDKNQSRRSVDLLSNTTTSKGSSITSRSRVHSKQSDTGSERTVPSDHLSSDGHTRNRNRAASHSGSDTDASRAYDSSPQVSRIKQSPGVPRSSSIKQPSSYFGTGAKVPAGHSHPCPLPSPPLSPPGFASSPTMPTISSVSNASARSRQSGVPQRPRANTLSSATLLSNRSTALQPGPSTSTTYQKAFASENKATPGISPETSPDELREALVLQRKKYAQLQEYIITITKRYEDDRVALTKTVEKLERDIRKKTQEIEGLRWLVIHHGAVEDIDAAASLARSSLTQDEGNRPDTDRESSPATSRRGRAFASQASAPTTGVQTGLGVYSSHTRQSSSAMEVSPSLENLSAASSQTSLATHPAPAKTLSAIPERPSLPGSPQYDISRAERQQAKEERRATRALRRVSGSSGSSFSSGANLLMHASTDGPKESMKDVIEKLRPFGNN